MALQIAAFVGPVPSPVDHFDSLPRVHLWTRQFSHPADFLVPFLGRSRWQCPNLRNAGLPTRLEGGHFETGWVGDRRSNFKSGHCQTITPSLKNAGNATCGHAAYLLAQIMQELPAGIAGFANRLGCGTIA
jgi:hypothetical protein